MSAPSAGEHPGGTGARLRRHSRLRRALKDSQVRVALVVATCLLVEAIVAKNVLEVKLDPIAQIAPMWVFLVYTWLGRRDRVAELAMMATAVFVTAATLVVYAL